MEQAKKRVRFNNTIEIIDIKLSEPTPVLYNAYTCSRRIHAHNYHIQMHKNTMNRLRHTLSKKNNIIKNII